MFILAFHKKPMRYYLLLIFLDLKKKFTVIWCLNLKKIFFLFNHVRLTAKITGWVNRYNIFNFFGWKKFLKVKLKRLQKGLCVSEFLTFPPVSSSIRLVAFPFFPSIHSGFLRVMRLHRIIKASLSVIHTTQSHFTV